MTQSCLHLILIGVFSNHLPMPKDCERVSDDISIIFENLFLYLCLCHMLVYVHEHYTDLHGEDYGILIHNFGSQILEWSSQIC